MSSAVLALALIASAQGWAADISASTWDESAAANNSAPPLGWPSATMRPNEVSPTAREMMSAVKRWYNRANPTKTSGGSANVQTLTYTVPTTAYVAGDGYTFIAGFTNTGATTLNVDGLGAKAVKSGSAALGGGEIVAGRSVRVYYDGTAFQIESGAFSTVVGTNVALKATIGGAGRRVWREGFTTAGDGGAAPYTWSASNCSPADDGKRVQPSVTGCWIADFSGMKPTPKIWGAVGDGVANDRTALQAAITAMANNTLYLGPYKYKINTGVSSVAPIRIIGEGRSAYGLFYSSIVAGAVNINPILGASEQSYFGDFAIEAGAAGPNTAGAAIGTTFDSGNIIFERLWIYQPCIGMAINGGSQTISHVRIDKAAGAGCGGITVGALTTGASTVDTRIVDTTIQSDTVTRADFGIRIFDSGGLFLSNVDNLQSDIGTEIIPGQNQRVEWAFFNNSVLGDNTSQQGLTINTSHISAIIQGLQFTNTWTASSVAGDGIGIGNAAGSAGVKGLHFLGHRSFGNAGNGATVGGGVVSVTFDAVRFCGNGQGANGIGIIFGANVGLGAVRNSTIVDNCDGASLQPNFLYGIVLEGSNSAMIITGNELYGHTTPVLGVPTGASVVANNIGLNTAIGTIASATSIALDTPHPAWGISGTTPIQTITGGWVGREVRLISTTGAVPYVTGGNICNAVTSGSLGTVTGLWDSTCWRLMN